MTREFGRAHQGAGSLELLGGEQPQRVAHQHRYAVPAVQLTVGGIDESLAAPDRESVGGQSEVGLCFATTGGEEQQLDLRYVRGAAQRR
ncbi:Uncharacterised protein [Mycobacteroides abscessus subsp. abscessus]|nr:Uncharacterised protein [Mycobacteroides abscessus subsp. abscessus]